VRDAYVTVKLTETWLIWQRSDAQPLLLGSASLLDKVTAIQAVFSLFDLLIHQDPATGPCWNCGFTSQRENNCGSLHRYWL